LIVRRYRVRTCRFTKIMKQIEGGDFGDKEYFKPLVDSINDMSVGNDWFLVANDFASYLDAQARARPPCLSGCLLSDCGLAASAVRRLTLCGPRARGECGICVGP
jgi:Carbohydrate phosphorylase